jgi:hypothetical protein
MSDIIPYNEQTIERIPGRELVTPELLKMELPRFFLASPVYVGKHNQAGFVVGDRTPGQRPYWIGSDIMSYSPEEVERHIQVYKEFGPGAGIPEEKRYFYDTKGGLAALRFFAISEILNEILEKDKFIGPAMIRKICEEAAVPEEFEELPVCPPGCEIIFDYGPGSTRESNGLKTVIDLALTPLKDRVGSDYTSHEYVTFFPTVAYPSIVPVLEESVKEVVARFDEFGDRFGLLEKHEELKGNQLLLETSETP